MTNGSLYIVKEVKVYRFSIYLVDRTLSIIFSNPPTREDIEPIFRETWNKLSIKEQDQSWDWILILERIPTIPWFGMIETFYGNIEVVEKVMVDNGKANES